jgi:hypothetical protein
VPRPDHQDEDDPELAEQSDHEEVHGPDYCTRDSNLAHQKSRGIAGCEDPVAGRPGTGRDWMATLTRVTL